MTKPYKVRPYEQGAADVVDRKTNAIVGYVLQNDRGWEAFLIAERGRALPITARFYWSFAGGFNPAEPTYMMVTTHAHRSDAALFAWQAHQAALQSARGDARRRGLRLPKS